MKIKILDSHEATMIKKPRYNAWQTGHGAHVNHKKYNRNRQKQQLRKEVFG